MICDLKLDCIAVDHLVANAGVWSTCLLEEVTNITAFNKVMVWMVHVPVRC